MQRLQILANHPVKERLETAQINPLMASIKLYYTKKLIEHNTQHTTTIKGLFFMAVEASTNPLRDKILKTLQRYPHLSPSMLHTGIGPSIPGALWRPILSQLIQEGVVLEQTHTQNGQTYTVLCLAQTNATTTNKPNSQIRQV